MWIFKEYEKGDELNIPHESEFFRKTNLSEAVTREAIQNSLDAKLTNDSKVKISFEIFKLDYSTVRKFFEGLGPHLNACDIPFDEKNQGYLDCLLIEDFGTTGLTGDFSKIVIQEKKENNFFYFWYCKGGSDKGGKCGGRWGLGKTTFHLASKINTFFGYTIRNDDKRKLLMGKFLLKFHPLDNKIYQHFGYFYNDKTYEPLEGEIVDDFIRLFNIKRTNEPGLSILIPFISSEITREKMREAVIEHFCYTIICGNLEVVIKTNGQTDIINLQYLEKLKSQEDYKYLDFLLKTKNVPTKELKLFECGRFEISKTDFGDDFKNIKSNYEDGNIIGFKIPIEIIKKSSSECSKYDYHPYFEVFIQKDFNLKKEYEFWFRSGIRIIENNTLKNYPLYFLFVANEERISEFLGDAETPAHTSWKPDKKTFEAKYIKGLNLLKFIIEIGKKIYSLFEEPSENLDRDVLRHIFYLKKESKNMDKTTKRKSVASYPNKIESENIFDLYPLTDGCFKIKLNKNILNSEQKYPINIKILAAYDCSRGDPFKKYKTYDFDFSKQPIKIDLVSGSILRKEKNELNVSVLDENFELIASGFDVNRDLCVKIV